MKSCLPNTKASKRALLAGLILVPVLATGYWSQYGMQISTYYGLSIGGTSTNSLSPGAIYVGDYGSLGVGASGDALSVGHSQRTAPDPTNAHLTVQGASNFTTFVVYGDRAVVPGNSQLIINSPTSDIPVYNGQ